MLIPLLAMAIATGAPQPTFQVLDIQVKEPVNYNWSVSHDGDVATGIGWGPRFWDRAKGVVELKEKYSLRGVSGDGTTLVGSLDKDGKSIAVAVWRKEGTERGDRPDSRFATAASRDGSVVVTHDQKRAWKPDTGESVVLPKQDKFLAAHITPDGGIVVGEDLSVPEHAAKWDARTGTITELGGYNGELAPPPSPDPNHPSGPPMRHVWARGVNADGSVIVGYLHNACAPPVRWTPAKGWESLGWMPGVTLDSSSRGGAFAVSEDGSRIVGTCQGRAFLWTAKDGIRDLNDVLKDDGHPTAPWRLTSALGISGDGWTITGTCVDDQTKQTKVWIADLRPHGSEPLDPGNEVAPRNK